MAVITNDLGFEISFYAKSDGNIRFCKLKDGESRFFGKCEVSRENFWKNNKPVLLLDFVFGSLADEENLPIGLGFELPEDGEIALSAVAEAEKTQVDRWKKACLFQICIAFGLLETILFALALSLPTVRKVPVFVFAAAFGCLFFEVLKKRKQLTQKIRKLEK